MDVTVFAGKGGVGKSTLAAAYALAHAQDGPVAAIDYDGGKALSRVLCLPVPEQPNVFLDTDLPNLSLASVRMHPYRSIWECKAQHIPTKEYLQQFPHIYGLIPLHDMLREFYGIHSDLITLSHFATLTHLLEHAQAREISHVVLDVEPTVGLKKMLEGGNDLVRSLTNLRDKGWLTLRILSAGAPDIAEALKGDFIQQMDENGKRIIQTIETLQSANYFLVCNPTQDVVSQMLEDVYPLVHGQGTIRGYVVNNCQHEAQESEQIERVKSHAGVLPVFDMFRDPRLFQTDIDQRRHALLDLGKRLQARLLNQ